MFSCIPSSVIWREDSATGILVSNDRGAGDDSVDLLVERCGGAATPYEALGSSSFCRPELVTVNACKWLVTRECSARFSCAFQLGHKDDALQSNAVRQHERVGRPERANRLGVGRVV